MKKIDKSVKVEKLEKVEAPHFLCFVAGVGVVIALT